MGDAEIIRFTAVLVAGFVSGNGINYNCSDNDVVLSEVEVALVAQVGKIFLTSMGCWTIVLVISL